MRGVAATDYLLEQVVVLGRVEEELIKQELKYPGTSLPRKAAEPRPKVLSAFTGAGGLDLGLEAAGFDIIACLEIDPDARATIRANRPAWNVLEQGDVTKVARTLTPRDLNLRRFELDVLAGGPPCQPFSKAAQWAARANMGMKDHRSDCVKSFFRLVRSFLPRVVLLENVEGFARGNGSAMGYVESALKRIEVKSRARYRLHSKIVDACDYGVPQRRKRAILVIQRNTRGPFHWPFPTHREKPVRAWEALTGLPKGQRTESRGKWAPLLPSIPEGQNYLFHTDRGEGLPLFGYRTRYWSFLLKLAKNQPSWTLPAQPGPSTGPFHWKNRPLTIAEVLRLQTFPASWNVVGTYRSQLRQLGNATPPLLSEILGRAIGEQVFGLKFDKPILFLVHRRMTVPAAEPVRRVPQQFMSLLGKHPAHPGAGLGPSPRT